MMMPQMMDGLVDGKVKFFYVFGENLANTEPDIRHVEHCLESAEFMVCHDIFPTETTRFADVIFPAAAWSEDDGTFTNSERRVSRVRTVSQAPGQAKPNWWIFKELAKRLGHDWASNSGQEIWDNEISAPGALPGRGEILPHRGRRPAMAGAQLRASGHLHPAQRWVFYLRPGPLHPDRLDPAGGSAG